jgi:hypothetical protein
MKKKGGSWLGLGSLMGSGITLGSSWGQMANTL